MRNNTDTKHFTKPERILSRLLQENRIPFRAKVLIEGREVDFLIGKIAVEIDGHEQDPEKNNMLARLGYTPLHFTNQDIYNDREAVLKTIITHDYNI